MMHSKLIKKKEHNNVKRAFFLKCKSDGTYVFRHADVRIRVRVTVRHCSRFVFCGKKAHLTSRCAGSTAVIAVFIRTSQAEVKSDVWRRLWGLCARHRHGRWGVARLPVQPRGLRKPPRVAIPWGHEKTLVAGCGGVAAVGPFSENYRKLFGEKVHDANGEDQRADYCVSDAQVRYHGYDSKKQREED